MLVQGIDITYVELPLTKLKSFTGDMCRYNEYMQLFSSASQLDTATMEVHFSVPSFDVLLSRSSIPSFARFRSTPPSSVCKAFAFRRWRFFICSKSIRVGTIVSPSSSENQALLCVAYISKSSASMVRTPTYHRSMLEHPRVAIHSGKRRISVAGARRALIQQSFSSPGHLRFRTSPDGTMHPRRRLFVGCGLCGIFP